MGINIKNNTRLVNAKLGKETIDKLGTTFAIQYGLDGFSAVNNVVAPMPTDIKEYLEGNDDITIYACASNIDKLCEYALASFPNIEDLYLFKTSAIVVLEDDLSYLLDLNKIYVPGDLLSAYISAYPSLSTKFDTIVEDYTLTIPFIGETTLTSEYVDSIIAMLSNGEKNAITKLVIPADFSESSANNISWGYDFSELTNLNNNIWYGSTQIDFTTYTIYGSGQLTSSIVNSLQNQKLAYVTKVIIPIDFTSYESGSINAIQNKFTSLRYLETTYNAGAMIIDFQDTMWQEILTKITSLNKTLDAALVYARSMDFTSTYSVDNTVIVPPLNTTGGFLNYTNLVYAESLNCSGDRAFRSCSNLIKAKITITDNSIYQLFIDCFSLKQAIISKTELGIVTNIENMYAATFRDCRNLEKITISNITGFSEALRLDYSIKYTKDSLVELFNSLANADSNATSTTIILGATNLAKLTADDITIATNKGWTLQ